MKVEIRQSDYEIDAEEVIEREVKPFGKGSAHIIVPKKWLGHNVVVVFKNKVGQWLKGYKKKYAKEKKVPFPKAQKQ